MLLQEAVSNTLFKIVLLKCNIHVKYIDITYMQKNVHVISVLLNEKSENELNHVRPPKSVTGTLVASRISLHAPYNHNLLPLPKDH